MTDKIIAYKGFNKDMTCRDFQYEIGGEYEHDGEAIACKSGFHACEYPLDVFKYYSPAGSVFCVVEQSGDIARHDDDSKVASSKIAIKAAIDIPGMVSAAVEFIKERAGAEGTNSENGKETVATNTGNRSAATNTGYQSAATNTGDHSAATNTGLQSAATNTGFQSAATNTGDQSAATNTGYQSAATNTGFESVATNTGSRSAATNTGSHSVATNTGDQSAATNTGLQSAASVSGRHSVACALGEYSKAMAGADGAIVCVYRNDDGDLIHIRASKVGENGIKPDTWYTLDESGEFVEAK